MSPQSKSSRSTTEAALLGRVDFTVALLRRQPVKMLVEIGKYLAFRKFQCARERCVAHPSVLACFDP
jgi:hypothetical protein